MSWTIDAVLYQALLVRACGKLCATGSDRTAPELLGQIIEMGQRVAKGTTH